MIIIDSFYKQIKDEKTYISKAYEALSVVKNNTQNDKYKKLIEFADETDKELIKKINKMAEDIKSSSDVLIVIGEDRLTFLSKAIIEALTNKYDRKKLEVIYINENISSTQLGNIMEYIENRKISVNLIANNTLKTELAISFRAIKTRLKKKYGLVEYKRRIIVSTDDEQNTIKNIADIEGLRTFIFPKEKSSSKLILSVVGLLPVAVAGFDIEKLVNGSVNSIKYLEKDDKNQVLKYTSLRYYLHNVENKNLEIFSRYPSNLKYIVELIKYLLNNNEDEKVDNVETSVLKTDKNFTYLYKQTKNGIEDIFETNIFIKNPNKDIEIQKLEKDHDDLNYIAGKSMHEINKASLIKEVELSDDMGIPNIIIEIDKIDEENIGELLYFFMLTKAVYENM